MRLADAHERFATSDSPESTEDLAAELGALLSAPLVIALDGDLGAGKTAFTRGLVDGVFPGEGEFVSSPTWAVCNAYETDPPIHHYDLYRLSGEDDLESVGFRDSLEDAIVVVEWPTQVASVAALVDLEVQIRLVDASTRSLTLAARTARGAACLTALSAERWRMSPA